MHRLTFAAFLALAACGPQTPLPHTDGNNAPETRAETRPLTPVDVNNAIDRAVRPMPRPER